MDDRLIRIRESEKKSHIETYTNERLYYTNSWLQKPIKMVQDIMPLFEKYSELRVLDLGCGVGRNCICVAEKYKKINCVVDCVDLLEIAIEKLQQNAKEYNVSSKINGINKSIEEYDIGINSYDFIMAISALEHIDTEESFLKKLIEIKNGLRANGIVCLVINSNVKEINLNTKDPIDAQFEVNLPTEKIKEYLEEVFSGWNILKTSISEQEYDIPRDKIVSHLQTNVVTYVARKCN
ncbi:MAG: class I SAM-dependent methyltransferase [Agathobacter sp.]